MPWKNWTNNLGAKSLSLVTAVALWFSVTNQIEFNKTLAFPIEYVNWPTDLTSVQKLPEAVRARVWGKGKFLSLRLRHGFAKVDLSDSQVGWNRIALTSSNLDLPDDVDVSRTEILEPLGIHVEFDETMIRDIYITPTVVGTPDDRFVQVGRTFVNPPVARVKGPRKVLDDIELLATERIDIQGKRNTVRRRVNLQPTGSETVEIMPTEVEIGITIEPLSRRTIENVVLQLEQNLPKNLIGTLNPALMQIEIEGARSIVDVASKDVTSIVLRAESWSTGTSVLRFKEIRGRDVVYAPYDSFPLVAAPWGTDADAAPIGPRVSPRNRVPPAVKGEVVSTLPLPREVAVLKIVPDRLVLTVRPRPPEPELVQSPELSP